MSRDPLSTRSLVANNAITAITAASSAAQLCLQIMKMTAAHGCNAQVITWLLSVPGASKTVLEARIPYGGGKSMAEILGKEPETYACTTTAVEMARAAYRQAAHLSEFGVPILGVSCTCALATDRVKKGDHKATPQTHCDFHLFHLSLCNDPGCIGSASA